MRLTTDSVTLGYGATTIVDRVTLDIPDAATTVIVGANGCGKSTLLRGLARLLRPIHGACLLDGEAVHQRPTREVARILGLLPQQPLSPEGITVVDLVSRGRQPHRSALSRWSAADEAAVTAALEMTGTLELAARPVEELSGGQRQRVWIALALAQQPEILLLDEPTTFLDVAHQIDLLDLLHTLRVERGTTVVMVLHDLNLAARYADHLVAMCDGKVLAAGAPSRIVTPELVRDVFGLDSQVVPDPVSGTPLVVPIGRHHTPATPTPAKVS
ncbi:ABC transporter ATP-binding protein [Nocardioides sp. BP30]|uniref:ABC transporter ATP-binding protein n=1 Tax=Nocardioides sp. BP30 TaxID=3036374 RepID=UPI00246884A0|nr:ABC transporter ATP-binding protein [Nocardioides sp. BP30]WGL52311.1 ABC transporter ATP-binding protein [Nocardioides sp. BP30]